MVINKKNLGFADANNVGYRKAKGEYILFLNNDTKVTKTFLAELVRVLEKDSSIGGAQSKILLIDHPDTHDSVGAFLTPTGFLYHYGFGKKDSPKYDKEIELFTAKGACMMFKKEVLDTVAIDGNIFDPDYFAYFEESDLCHRVWLAGYRIVYAYKSVIYHKMGATSASMNNAFIQYHSFKNRIRTYLKNLQIRSMIPMIFIQSILTEGFSFFSLVRGNIQLAWAIQRALYWNITHLHETLKLRGIVQTKIRRVSDKDLAKRIVYKPSLSYYIDLVQGRIYE
ncbi:glycosyltransferase family 2 protein [Patescibacteria group bacterium]|nr:glycosyltransferase family 2 protein [Patescibacteria group bacterium]